MPKRDYTAALDHALKENLGDARQGLHRVQVGCTIIGIASDQKLLGLIASADRLRENYHEPVSVVSNSLLLKRWRPLP